MASFPLKNLLVNIAWDYQVAPRGDKPLSSGTTRHWQLLTFSKIALNLLTVWNLNYVLQ